jgi:acyl-CoA carboxylase epsilon subunit
VTTPGRAERSGGPQRNGGPAGSGGPAESGGPGGEAGDRELGGGAPAAEPVLRVVAGQPSKEELAALTVVVAALRTAGTSTPPQPRPGRGWGDRSAMMRAPLNRDLGWRRSTLPR